MPDCIVHHETSAGTDAKDCDKYERFRLRNGRDLA
jgi:hypothetical protein